MASRSALVAAAFAWIPFLPGCGSTPTVVLRIRTDPAGADVYLSRRGQKAYEGSLAVVKGDMRAEPVVEDFVRLGTTPIEYTSPLEERVGGGSVLGVGVRVVHRYGDGLLRVEKEGFATVERSVRFQEGEVRVDVKLEALTPADEERTAAR